MNNLLAASDITGSETVATYFGITKVVTLKVMKFICYPLDKVGDI